MKYLIIAFTALLPYFSMGQNLVLNGNFSTQPTNQWVPVPPVTATENYLYETSYGGTVNTNYVAEVDGQANLRQVNIPVIPGKKYYFSYLRSRRTGNGAASNPNNVNVKIYDVANIYINRTDQSTNTTFAWTCTVDSFVASSTSVSIDITNPTNGASLGTIVDKITIAAAEQPVTITGTVCQGSDFTLHLPPQDANTQFSNFQWTGPNGFTATDSVINLTNVQPSQSGTYTCTMTLNNSCLTLKAIYTVVVQPTEIVRNESICIGTVYDFYGRQLSQAGTYDTLIQSNTGSCDSLITLHLKILPDPITTLNLQDTISICEKDSIVIEAYAISGYVYQWYRDNNQMPGATQSSLKLGESGTYYVNITTADGCTKSSDAVVLEVIPRPRTHIEKNFKDNFCAMDTVVLRATGDISETEYSWEPRSRIEPFEIGNRYQDVIVTLPESGYIYMTAYGRGLCTTKDSVYITVYPCCDVAIPSAFTPNGDGKNDLFKPHLQVGQKIILFRIYNRFGQLVYESRTNSINGWDGLYKGKPAEQGTYMWHLSYECNDKKIYKKSGDITLLR